ncbi:MAG: sugar phosphate isomerase/epimerase [Clostridia bacterium]|nr:sugar phosphate isomerase/epimerase [Clostridia bacterium]
MYQLPLGVSIAAKKDDFYQKIDEAKSLSFDSVDFDLTVGGYYNGDDEIEELKKRAAYLKASGLRFNGVHIPYGAYWDISTKDDGDRTRNLDNIKKAIAWLDAFQLFCYILHGSSGPIMDKDRDWRIENLIVSVKELEAYTKTPIAVENLPRTCLLSTTKEWLAVAKKLKKRDFCLDVNHFLQEYSHEAVKKIGRRFITTHISDHDYVNERHWMPKKGKIDWMQLIGVFEKIGYQGVFNYELVGEFTLADVKDNYVRLFENYNAIR